MFRKTALVLPLLLAMIVLSSCGKRNLPTDKPLDDGSFFYRNEAYGFSLILPAGFDYYQTQRVEGKGYGDIEFYIPTSDTRFGNKLPGYAEPIVIRVFEENVWNDTKQGENSMYRELGKKDGKVYAIEFWEMEPKDWQDRWSAETEQKIIDSFKIE